MSRLALLLVLVGVAACGKVKTVGGGSDGGGGGDEDAGGGTIDAGNPGDPLNGEWQWWIGENAESADTFCDVTIGAGEYEVYCPSEPYEVVAGCMKTKNDTRIRGSWLTAFDGSFDEIDRWEGDTCSGNGYEPDVNIVHEGVLVMEADQDESSPEAGFLPQAFGLWNWAAWDGSDTADRFECEVTFEPAEDEGAAHFAIECLSEPTTPVGGCTETNALLIEGTIDVAEMTAEAWNESRYEGAGCAPDYPDPVVEDEHTPMGATRR